VVVVPVVAPVVRGVVKLEGKATCNKQQLLLLWRAHRRTTTGVLTTISARVECETLCRRTVLKTFAMVLHKENITCSTRPAKEPVDTHTDNHSIQLQTASYKKSTPLPRT
jgi:hypothetical protein